MIAFRQALVLRCVQKGDLSDDGRDGQNVCRRAVYNEQNKQKRNSTDGSEERSQGAINMSRIRKGSQSHASAGWPRRGSAWGRG